MQSMDWVKAIICDFWGTLVDVDSSGEAGMAKVLARIGRSELDPRQVYLDWDAATVRRYSSGPWRPYLEWGALGLRDTLAEIGTNVGEPEGLELAELLISTMTTDAAPHPEVLHIIAGLRSRYPLMPITNMDARLFEMNDFKQQFALSLIAEEAGAFKPSAVIFSKALAKLGVPAENVLHVSLSQFADLEGAMPVGMQVAWVNRGGETLGPHTPKSRFEFRDLRGVVELFGL